MSTARQIEERAALWVLHREEPSWSSTDQAELDAWLSQSDAHKAAFWRLECGWRKADRIASLGAPLQPRRVGFGELSWGRPLALAASILIVFTVVLLQWPRTFTAPQDAAAQFQTPIGGHQIVSLPDGTRVELNTDTAIKAVVDEHRRAVWLERGEAFFEVAKQHGRNFVIYAGPRTVTVLGTKFSVRRDPREVVVAVLEGRVSVDAAAANASDRHTTITAGDIAIARGKSTLITTSAEAVQQQLAWRSGRLIFHDATLGAAVEQFNRYNETQLVLQDADLARLLVGGSFVARNVRAFAQLLKDSYGLEVDDAPGKIVLAARRLPDRGALHQLRAPLIASRPKNVGGSDCGFANGDCAVVPLTPAPQPAEVTKAAEERAMREANNWQVLYKLYPPRARAAHEEGTVGFTVSIDAAGNPASCKIRQSSGHPLLDLETCELIMTHATFKRADGMSRSQQRSYEGVVNWKLPAAAPPVVPAAPKRIAEAPPAEQLICKRTLRTGSNAAFERKCMTKSEWQRVSDEVRYDFDRLPTTGMSCEGSPQCR
jgi:transmembrane sensor